MKRTLKCFEHAHRLASLAHHCIPMGWGVREHQSSWGWIRFPQHQPQHSTAVIPYYPPPKGQLTQMVRVGPWCTYDKTEIRRNAAPQWYCVSCLGSAISLYILKICFCSSPLPIEVLPCWWRTRSKIAISCPENISRKVVLWVDESAEKPCAISF